MIRSRVRRAKPGRLPNVAAITMVRDEGAMLGRWVDHYAAQLGHENLVVVDDNSSDGSTDNLPCTVLRLPPITKHHFEPTRMGVLSRLADSLLHVHDAVMFSDADEFVVADPGKYDDLRHFVSERADKQVMGVVALNVVHHSSEPALDLSQPVLVEQRGYAKFLPLMCKPQLRAVHADWRWASHGITAPFAIDPELFMFHLKFADRDLLRASGERRKAVVEMDGRAASTSWRLGGDEMVSVLDQISETVDLAEVKPFRVPSRRLKEVVEKRPDGTWRTVGGGQVAAMRKQPLVRIPDRFRGVV